MLRQMLRRINNYIFPDETPLTFVYPRWWWNRMRSSCWNAPVVSVLLGLIGGVCWASLGYTGLASDPKQLLSRQGLQLRMPNPCPCSSPGRHIWKTLLWPSEGHDPAVNVFGIFGWEKHLLYCVSVFGKSYFQETAIHLSLQQTFAGSSDKRYRKILILLDFYTPGTPCFLSVRGCMLHLRQVFETH